RIDVFAAVRERGAARTAERWTAPRDEFLDERDTARLPLLVGERRLVLRREVVGDARLALTHPAVFRACTDDRQGRSLDIAFHALAAGPRHREGRTALREEEVIHARHRVPPPGPAARSGPRGRARRRRGAGRPPRSGRPSRLPPRRGTRR